VTVSDLGSSNGTWVNGDRVSTKPIGLSPGSTVSFGDLAFTYRPVS